MSSKGETTKILKTLSLFTITLSFSIQKKS